jgi:hypothetical protein
VIFLIFEFSWNGYNLGFDLLGLVETTMLIFNTVWVAFILRENRQEKNQQSAWRAATDNLISKIARRLDTY